MKVPEGTLSKKKEITSAGEMGKKKKANRAWRKKGTLVHFKRKPGSSGMTRKSIACRKKERGGRKP